MASKSKTTEVPVVQAENVVKPIALAEEAGVRPQMVYNYIRNERLEAFSGQIEGDNRVQLLITREVADEWLESYRARKAERAAKKEAETSEEEPVEASA